MASPSTSKSDRKRPMPADESVVSVSKLETLIVNCRDAAGRGGAVREFILVFPGLLSNTRTGEVMRMVEHQLKQKLRSIGNNDKPSETRLVLAGAGMTVVQNVGGGFESSIDDHTGQEVGVYVPEDNSIALSSHSVGFMGPATETSGSGPTLQEEPVQWKQFGGWSGLYNLLDGSFLEERELLSHPGKGLEEKDVNAMVGYRYALLEAQLYLMESLWHAFNAAPRANNKAVKVAVREVGDGVSTGVLSSPVDMAVRVLAQSVPEPLKPHTAKVISEIEEAVDEVATQMDGHAEETLRFALIQKLKSLKRTVHFKTYHPDRRAKSGLSIEEATTMAAWLEEVYSYILKRRLKDGGGDERDKVVVECE